MGSSVTGLSLRIWIQLVLNLVYKLQGISNWLHRRLTLFLASSHSIVSAGNCGCEHIVAHYIERESLIFINARVLLKRMQVDENGPNKVKDLPSGHLHRRRKLRGEFFRQFVHETAQQAPFKGSLVNEHRRTFQL